MTLHPQAVGGRRALVPLPASAPADEATAAAPRPERAPGAPGTPSVPTAAEGKGTRPVAERSLAGYLAMPRPKDLTKAALMPLVKAGRMVAALLPQVRDVRRGGSAAAALCQVATGRADAAWTPGLQPWDCAAGVLLAQEAGAAVGDLDGLSPGTWPASGDVLAAPPAFWPLLRDLLTQAYGHGGHA